MFREAFVFGKTEAFVKDILMNNNNKSNWYINFPFSLFHRKKESCGWGAGRVQISTRCSEVISII